MALHKDLTGAELHEPKGVDSATDGDVYVADGAGSGTWENKYSDIIALNQYWQTGQMADISNPGDRVYFFVPVQSEVTSLTAILDGGITVANSILSIYINGVLFADTLTVPFAGSTNGTVATVNTTTANTISGGSVIEVRTDGASTTSQKAYITLGLRAKA
jgi:hypothetical protein